MDQPAAQGEGRPEASEDLVFRRGKLRKRDDPAMDLFREAHAHLDDLPRVKRLLLELGRLYDPVRNGPILDPSTRRRVIELVAGGELDEARDTLEQCVKDYRRADNRT